MAKIIMMIMLISRVVEFSALKAGPKQNEKVNLLQYIALREIGVRKGKLARIEMNEYIIEGIRKLFKDYPFMNGIIAITTNFINIDQKLNIIIDCSQIISKEEIDIIEDFFANKAGKFVESITIKKGSGWNEIFLNRLFEKSLFLLKKISFNGSPGININSIVGLTKIKRELEEIDFSLCNLHQIPNFVWQNPNTLRILNLSNNPNIDLNFESQWRCLEKLETIDLGYCNLVELPDFLSNTNILTTLKKLDLRGNYYLQLPNTEMPIEWPGFLQLKELNLNGCNLKEMPIEILIKNKEIKILDLGNNYEINLNKNIELWVNMVNLQELNLEKCNIEYIPAFIFLLGGSLKRLNLYNNQNIILNSHGWENLTKLERLDINYCNLKEIPNCVWQLRNTLKELNISGNLGIHLRGPWDTMLKIETLRAFGCGFSPINIKRIVGRIRYIFA